MTDRESIINGELARLRAVEKASRILIEKIEDGLVVTTDDPALADLIASLAVRPSLEYLELRISDIDPDGSAAVAGFKRAALAAIERTRNERNAP